MDYKKYSPLIFIGSISIFLNLFLHYIGAFSLVETKLYDYRFKLRGPLTELRENEQDVVIVEIDDESYSLISESYPYSRGRVWSNVIKNLVDAGTSVIVFDIMFDAPDHTSKIIENYLSSDCQNCSSFNGDEQFSESVLYAKRNGVDIVLASKITNDVNRIPSDYIIYPTKSIMSENVSTGLVNVVADNIDYVFKRYPIFYRISSEPKKLYLTLAVQSVLDFKDIEFKNITQDVKNKLFKIDNLSINTYDKEASFLINYSGPRSSIFNTFKKYSLYQVIDDNEFDLADEEEDDDWMDKYINPDNFNYSRFGIEKSPFKEKIVIIGSSLQEDNDFVITPFYNYMGIDNLMPGVEMHANAIQQIIDEDYIQVPTSSLKLSDKSIFNQISILIILTLIGLFISNRKSLISSISLVLTTIFIWTSFSIGAFLNDYFWIVKSLINFFGVFHLEYNYIGVNESILIPVFYPIASILITFSVNLGYKLLNEQKDKRLLKQQSYCK